MRPSHRVSATSRSADRRRSSTPRARSTVPTPAACRSRSSTARSSTIDGSHKNPVTDGYICAKVRKFGERVYGPDRLLYPAVRKGRKGEGRFERVPVGRGARARSPSACSDAKARVRAAQSILPYSYGGSNGLLTQDNLDAHALAPLRHLAAGAHGVRGADRRRQHGALRQDAVGHLPGLSRGALIILWGVNPSASGIHLMPYVREAQKRGAKLVVIDPRSTPLARSADVHLPVKPGTDVAVALAIHRYLFDDRPRRRGVSCDAHARRRPSCASAPSGGRSSRPRTSPASSAGALEQCRRALRATARRRSSAAAGASSATATAATPRWRSWRCRRSAASSASAAAATR